MIADNSKVDRQVDEASLYSRKILLATVGLSPQVVTETAYALMMSDNSPFIPSEIVIISTTTGAKNAKEKLLGTANARISWLERLYREYSSSSLPTVDFVTVTSRAGIELDDIDSIESSAAFADKILETVREITNDDNSILYASIAGGRKTMSFYLGYALSVLGRDRDRLYHVLVAPPFESNPEFYFPTRDTQMPRDQKGLVRDNSDAIINLVNIPFVRLRYLDHKVISQSLGFEESIESLNKSYDHRLVIDVAGRKLQVGDTEIKLQPIDFAIYLVFVHSRCKGEESLSGPRGRYDKTWGQKILKECELMCPDKPYPYGLPKRTVKVLEEGVDAPYLVSHLSKIRHLLKRNLGTESHRYTIESKGKSSYRYCIEIKPQYIEII